MNVVVITEFDDVKKGVRRYQGEEFVVSKERFDEINAVGMRRLNAPLVKEKEAPKAEQKAEEKPAAKKPARKATGTRKAASK